MQVEPSQDPSSWLLFNTNGRKVQFRFELSYGRSLADFTSQYSHCRVIVFLIEWLLFGPVMKRNPFTDAEKCDL